MDAPARRLRHAAGHPHRELAGGGGRDEGRTDDGLLGFSLFTYAAPEYWIGMILILLFAVEIPLFPAGLQTTPGAEFDSWFAHAADVAQHMVLPVTALTLVLLGQYFVIMRSSMVDVLTEDFITVKRATGLPWNVVVRKHAVRNALLPLVTLSAIQFGFIVGGASRSRRSSRGPASACSSTRRSTPRTSRCSRGPSSSSRSRSSS